MTETTSIFHVECPSCLTSFPVDPAKVPEGGVFARCSECAGVFRVETPAPVVPTARAEWTAPTPAPPVPEAPPTPAVPEAPPAVAEPLSADPTPAPEAAVETPAAPAHEPFSLDTLDAPSSAPATSTPEPEQATDDLGLPHVDPIGVAPPAPAVEPAPPTPTFGRRDPKEKARRLARVLVSDMITYNADRHTQALANGTLEADFDDEIKKSWSEYVDQVGSEIAESTPFFTDALNEILARGKPLF